MDPARDRRVNGPKTLFLLPGFLGEARDFDAFRAALREIAPDLKAEPLDWMDQASALVSENFETLGAALAQELAARVRPGESYAILGYSLGGRIALALYEHLRASGDSRTEFIFVSTNPGLDDPSAREARFKTDSLWAGRFRSEDWSVLMKDWNAQPVFDGSVNEPDRQRRKGQRDLLAKVLMNWSLADQPNFGPLLRKNEDYLWVTGGRDVKFTRLAEGVNNSRTIPTASHRVHLDAPAELARLVREYLQLQLSRQREN